MNNAAVLLSRNYLVVSCFLVILKLVVLVHFVIAVESSKVVKTCIGYLLKFKLFDKFFCVLSFFHANFLQDDSPQRSKDQVNVFSCFQVSSVNINK